jgi:predicted DNA-binding antitoxin AbrB/MazE fold protein
MSQVVEAIYENGVLRPLAPLQLAEHARVLVAVESSDDERAEWLTQSQRTLTKVWDNSADDVFNDLLTH